MLIGLDCAGLNFALQEVIGRPGQPIARLTLLGWTCVGNLDSNLALVLQSEFHIFYKRSDRNREIKQQSEKVLGDQKCIVNA